MPNPYESNPFLAKVTSKTALILTGVAAGILVIMQLASIYMIIRYGSHCTDRYNRGPACQTHDPDPHYLRSAITLVLFVVPMLGCFPIMLVFGWALMRRLHASSSPDGRPRHRIPGVEFVSDSRRAERR